jgi:hypothetical protein
LISISEIVTSPSVGVGAGAQGINVRGEENYR